MTAAQPDLPLDSSPSADAADAARLATFLSSRPSWVTAAEIRSSLGLSDRRIRQLAHLSAGIIVSAPGCPGYKHLLRATAAELAAAASSLEHQASLMSRRACRLRAAAHRSLHHLPPA